MADEKIGEIVIENHAVYSAILKRVVIFDCYVPIDFSTLTSISLLLINDGQDLIKMPFEEILEPLLISKRITPLFCVGIHCAPDRKSEYGTAMVLDYKGRGAKANEYSRFVMEELLPYLRQAYNINSFKEKAFAGFSLGGLSAIDIAWNYPAEFTTVGIFSGSFWWRDKGQAEKDFDEDTDRIMQRLIREGNYAPSLKFFFEVGTLDETADRNNNGVIDSIDDTLSIIEELTKKGYRNGRDIHYLEIKDGQHNVETWARAFPVFLEWGWGINKE